MSKLIKIILAISLLAIIACDDVTSTNSNTNSSSSSTNEPTPFGTVSTPENIAIWSGKLFDRTWFREYDGIVEAEDCTDLALCTKLEGIEFTDSGYSVSYYELVGGVATFIREMETGGVYYNSMYLEIGSHQINVMQYYKADVEVLKLTLVTDGSKSSAFTSPYSPDDLISGPERDFEF